jgi:hypothetical protein
MKRMNDAEIRVGFVGVCPNWLNQPEKAEGKIVRGTHE